MYVNVYEIVWFCFMNLNINKTWTFCFQADVLLFVDYSDMNLALWKI